jgi:hypothetical protein
VTIVLQSAVHILAGIFRDTWDILNESSAYILLGFVIAALLRVIIPDKLVAGHFGRNGAKSVFKAALLGVPLPLCSCGVVPAAISLRRQGASRGATTAFLVSTPETGVDSIAITYALLDPLMTIFRPIAAFITAIIAGLIENAFPERCELNAAPAEIACSGCDGGCVLDDVKAERKTARMRLRESFEYAFGDLLADIGKWLIFGLVLAGIIAHLVPEDFFSGVLGKGIVPMLIMLGVGIPFYVCATASTPIAAALVLKGLSPGAALVFLLAGPATNAATMMVVGKFMGRRSLFIYVGTIAAVSLVMGFALDVLYGGLGLKLVPAIASGGHAGPGWFSIGMSIVLVVLIGRSLFFRKGDARDGEGSRLE